MINERKSEEVYYAKRQIETQKTERTEPGSSSSEIMKDIDACMKVLFTIVFGFAGVGCAAALLEWLGIR